MELTSRLLEIFTKRNCCSPSGSISGTPVPCLRVDSRLEVRLARAFCCTNTQRWNNFLAHSKCAAETRQCSHVPQYHTPVSVKHTWPAVTIISAFCSIVFQSSTLHNEILSYTHCFRDKQTKALALGRPLRHISIHVRSQGRSPYSQGPHCAPFLCTAL